MATATFTKTGTKATTAAKLDKAVFGLEVKNHDLLKQAYLAHLANRRIASANTKKRGAVSGGGIKPWAQKGTGRARVGSIRSPIWRGGGIVFGPTCDQNYTHSLSPASKRQAVRQALSLADQSGKVVVIETFECKDGKVSATAALLKKMNLTKNTLLVVSVKDALVERATRNLSNVKAVQAKYLNVPDILDADHIVMSNEALKMVSEWLAAVKEGAK
jgi:large subunit ribosomal protein L4